MDMEGYAHIPETGGAIVVSNHLGRLDAILGVLLTDRDDFILMIAEKYQKYAFWRWWAKKVNALWLNRYEADFHAMREVFRRLNQGEILGLAPEGTRSLTETLAEGKPGAVYLAAKTSLPLIPVGVTGTEDRVVKARLTHLKRLDIRIRIGEPIYLPPMDRKNRDAFLQQNTEEIMCQIAALLPPEYRGFYAGYPRVQEIIDAQEEMAAAVL
jgi:1-acyl-sn-glycerol-3-phosphate acyltransferase